MTVRVTNRYSAGRRRLLTAVAVVAAGVVLTSCTSNTPKSSNSGSTSSSSSTGAAATGKKVRILFSGPVADHGFLAAINSFAKAEAAKYPDVDFKALEAAADAPS
jgi:ribose transport system substrate-binding protein